MSLKRRFSLALLLVKMIFIAIFEEIWFLLSVKAKVLINFLFKTPSSRIGFYCVILIFLMTFAVTKMLLNLKNDILGTTILCVALLAWLIFIVVAVSGRHQSHIIRILKAKLANVQDEAELLGKVSFFSDKAKIPKPAVYLTNEPYVTALSVGKLGGGNIIVLNSEIFKLLDEDELDSVIAHEICHIKHLDSLLSTILIFTFCLVFVLFWEIFLNPINMVRESWKGIKSSYKRHEQLLFFGGLFLVIPIMTLVLIIGIPIRNIFHEQELRADTLSSCFTGNPLVLKSTILKLATFVQMHRDYSFELGVLNIVKPLPCGWVRQKMFQFLYPKNTYRMHMLTLLDKLGIVPKPK